VAEALDGTPPTVYLHIGAPKSGTTFLQGVLWNNTAALAEAGVLLPGGSFAAQVRGMRDLRGLEPEPGEPDADWHGAWDGLAAEVRASSARVAVISSEVISAVDPAGAARAVASLAPCEVHLVYSARDIAGLLPSEWQEYVKHRFHYDFDLWLREVVDGPRDQGAAEWFWKVHDIPEVIGRWAPHVPPERVHVLTVPRSGAPRDLLWRRFAALIGIDPDVADLSDVRSNASLSHTETELLRKINNAVGEEAPMWLYHRYVTNLFALEVLPGKGVPGRVGLPPARAEWAGKKAHELVEHIRAAGYDVAGDLDELLPPDTGGAAPAEPAAADIADAAAAGIVGLLDRIGALEREIEELRERNAGQRRELDALVEEMHRQRAEQQQTPLPKLMARELSERNPAVWKMRVGYWHLVERLRGVEQPDEDAPREEGPEGAEAAPEPPPVPVLSRRGDPR
jgi:hypothetical protein